MQSSPSALNASGQYRKVANERGGFEEVEPGTRDNLMGVRSGLPSARERVCDTVRVRSAMLEAQVHLVDGQVAWVVARPLEGGRAPRSFFARLIDEGGVSKQGIDGVMAVCKAESRNFSETLVQLGMIDQTRIRDLFRAHVVDHVRELLASPHLEAAWQRRRTKFTGELTVALSDVLEADELQRWRDVVMNADGHPERRAAERRKTAGHKDVFAVVKTPRGGLDLSVEDLSNTGALLVTDNEIAPGTTLDVMLHVGGKALELTATVARVRPANDDVPLAVGVAWSAMAGATRLALIRALAALK